MGEPSNVYDELEALKAGIIAAVTPNPVPGDSRPVSVRNRPYSGIWNNYPLVEIGDDQWFLDRGEGQILEQQAGRPSWYILDLYDAVPQRSDDPEREGNTLSTILLLEKAIVRYFDVKVNRCLGEAVSRAGENWAHRRVENFKQSPDGDLIVWRRLGISVYGLRHRVV